MSYSIRVAEEKDIPQLEALELNIFSSPWTAEQLRTYICGDRYLFLVAVNPNDQVLGYVNMDYVLDEGNIGNVAVDPQYRRQGIAAKLLQRLSLYACELKLSIITLEVRSGNGNAIRVYEKQGYSAVGLRKNYYNSPREDAIIMQKKIPSDFYPDGL